MIYAGEKLLDIALQYPARLSPVPAYLPSMAGKSCHSPMGALTNPARVRIVNESRLKNRIQMFDDCMM